MGVNTIQIDIVNPVDVVKSKAGQIKSEQCFRWFGLGQLVGFIQVYCYFRYFKSNYYAVNGKKFNRQAGAELGQAQLKLGLGFILIFFVDLVSVEIFFKIDLVEFFIALLKRFGLVNLFLQILNRWLGRFNCVDWDWQIWFNRFG